MQFRLIETVSSLLWDYGWFDLSHFEVLGPREERDKPTCVVRAFFLDPISQRSFCTQPDPWGAARGHHGPLLHPFAAHECSRALSPQELRCSMQAVMNGPDTGGSPSRAQMAPLEAWLERIEVGGGSMFQIDVPASASLRVDWDYIWLIFREYAHVSASGDQLTIAVIGYD